MLEYGTDAAYGLKTSEGNLVLDHSLILTGLSPSSTYHFRVSSTDASGNGPTLSGDYSFTTLTTSDVTPPVISNVRVSGITDRVAVISWETDEPANSTVEYGTTAFYGSLIADNPFVFEHQISVSGLNASTTYHFKVGSTDATGNGPAFSGDFSFTTLAEPDRTPPTIINLRVEGITANSAMVLWETDEIANSFVEYGTNASYSQNSADPSLLLLHNIFLQGLHSDTTYHLRVTSTDSSGNTGMGEDLTFKTNATPSPLDTTPPVISGVEVSGITNSRAVIMWNTDELADSEVLYGTSESYGLKVSDRSFTIVHSVLLEGLNASTTYHVMVMSKDIFSNGPASGIDITFTTTAGPDVTAPKILNIMVTNITHTGATISWNTDEPSDSIVEFGNHMSYGHNRWSQSNVIQHTIMLTGLSPDTMYHFRVSSTDPSGNSAAFSTDKRFTTLGSSQSAVSVALLPWLWVGLALIITCLVGAFLAYRRYLSQEERIAGIGGGTLLDSPATANSDISSKMAATGPYLPSTTLDAKGRQEDIETLEMEPTRALIPIRHIRCGRCKVRIPIYAQGEQHIRCPNCGKTGIYRPKL
jgi:hypothetical protein